MNRINFLNTSFFILSIIILFYVCAIGIHNLFRYNAFNKDYNTAAKHYLNELHLNKEYIKQLLLIDTPEYWELLAKEKLGYTNKNEVVFKILY